MFEYKWIEKLFDFDQCHDALSQLDNNILSRSISCVHSLVFGRCAVCTHTQIAVVSQSHLFHIFSLRKLIHIFLLDERWNDAFILNSKCGSWFLCVSDSKILTMNCIAWHGIAWMWDRERTHRIENGIKMKNHMQSKNMESIWKALDTDECDVSRLTLVTVAFCIHTFCSENDGAMTRLLLVLLQNLHSSKSLWLAIHFTIASLSVYFFDSLYQKTEVEHNLLQSKWKKKWNKIKIKREPYKTKLQYLW